MTELSHVVQVRAEGPKAPSPGQRPGYVGNQQGALKGQKLLAQGIALGMMAISKSPWKGKSFMFCLEFLKLLPFQGDKFVSVITQGDALG